MCRDSYMFIFKFNYMLTFWQVYQFVQIVLQNGKTECRVQRDSDCT